MKEHAAQDVLDFWFGAPGTPAYGTTREQWFRKDPAFDGEIRDRFDATLAAALASGLDDWTSPRATLARVLVLDQFTRNCYRDSARAFAGDALALAAAGAAVDQRQDRELIPVERWFLYMPFEHAESAAAQQRSLALFARLRDEDGLAGPLEWAEKHAAVIHRFGRFPHRNALLGRASTPEEVAFLATPGSRF
ncbi:MAG: DUF924 family protein [Casimicrobiaceae bacterium]